jgi:acetyl-CoA synthetase
MTEEATMPDHVNYASHPTSPRLTESAGRVAKLRAEAASDLEGFWKREATSRIAWVKPPTKIKNTSFEGDVSIKWFEDGTLNVAAQLPRPAPGERGDQTAIIWEGDGPAIAHITYRELHADVCRFANVLKRARRAQGRSRHHLPADDPRGRGRHAGLRPHRRHPFGGLRRLLARILPAASGLRLARRHHRRRGLRGGKTVPLKANVDGERLPTCP